MGIVIMARKLVLVILVCAFRSPWVKAILVAFVLQAIVAFALLMRHRPYVETYHNILDNLTLIASVVLLWGGTITSNALLLVVLGVLYEFWRIKARDKEEVDDFFGESGIEAAQELEEFDDPAAQGLDNFSPVDVDWDTQSQSAQPQMVVEADFGAGLGFDGGDGGGISSDLSTT